jgi:hypothetical protein
MMQCYRQGAGRKSYCNHPSFRQGRIQFFTINRCGFITGRAIILSGCVMVRNCVKGDNYNAIVGFKKKGKGEDVFLFFTNGDG